MPSGAILTKAGAILPQPDCNSRRGIAPNCTKLHQIAVIAPKNQKGEKQAGRKVFRPDQWAIRRR
jgi:hypothetical protein